MRSTPPYFWFRFTAVLIPVSYISALTGLTLWIILCVEDGYARKAATAVSAASEVSARSSGRHPFDSSMTTGKIAGLTIFAVGSLGTLAGILGKDMSMTRFNPRRRNARRNI